MLYATLAPVLTVPGGLLAAAFPIAHLPDCFAMLAYAFNLYRALANASASTLGLPLATCILRALLQA